MRRKRDLEEESHNADTEGQFEGTIPNGQPADSSPFTDGSTISEGAAGTGAGGSELPPNPFADSGGHYFGDSVSEAPKSKRKYTKRGTGTGKLSADKLAAARRKFADLLAGSVGFGCSWYGGWKAKKYLPISPVLAQAVYNCYTPTEEEAYKVGEPLADTFILWFPKWVEPAAKGIDPAVGIVRAVMLLQKMDERERQICAAFRQQYGKQPPTNGQEPTPPDFNEQVNEWMKQQSPQPEEILTG